jgi:hypothetical protein
VDPTAGMDTFHYVKESNLAVIKLRNQEKQEKFMQAKTKLLYLSEYKIA